MRMQKSLGAILVVACWAHVPAQAATITVGSHSVIQGTSSFDIDILISGGDLVTDMVGAVQIGDGGTIVGGSDSGPVITAISYADSIWTSAPGGFTSFFGSVSPPELIVDPNVSLNVGGETVAASGILLTVTVDVTGIPAGTTKALMLGSTAAGSTALQNAGQAVPLTINNGSITIARPVRTWSLDAFGDWNDPANWAPAGVPDGNTETVIFGDVITSPRAVTVDTAVTVREMRFDSAISYVIFGGGSIKMEADTGNAAINVNQGAHVSSTAVNLNDDTDVDIAAGASLVFNNALNLNGRTLTKTGDGLMNIRNQLNTGGGWVVVVGGTLGGTGEIIGSVVNSSGSIAPGDSAGALSIEGSYGQGAGATLAVELEGTAAGQFDVLDITGTAVLDGALDVSLLGGFTPTDGDTWVILTADGGITGAFDSITPGYSASLINGGTAVELMFGAGVLLGDMDGSGAVNNNDISPFVMALTDRPTYIATYGLDPDVVGDIEGSGQLNNNDITPFVNLLAGAPQAVPEPATMALLALGGLALVRRRR